MSKIYLIFNQDNEPDVWSVVNIDGSTEFNESDLPENYEIEFAKRTHILENGKIIRKEVPQDAAP